MKSNIEEKYSNLTCLYSRLYSFRYLYSKIRNVNTSCLDFAKFARRIMRIIIEEGVALYGATKMIDIKTPTDCIIQGYDLIDDIEMVAVSIIRAGDSMLDMFLSIHPETLVGKILIQRNEETIEPMLYYSKFPSFHENQLIFVLDPMLATGGSAILAIQELVKKGANINNIVYLNVISSPEGIEHVFETYPNLKILTGVIDDGLNDKQYIIPGLGDFGDRFYGTVHNPSRPSSPRSPKKTTIINEL